MFRRDMLGQPTAGPPPRLSMAEYQAKKAAEAAAAAAAAAGAPRAPGPRAPAPSFQPAAFEPGAFQIAAKALSAFSPATAPPAAFQPVVAPPTAVPVIDSSQRVINEDRWDRMINLCKFETFSATPPEVAYKAFDEFLEDLAARSKEFNRANQQKAGLIIATVKFILQKIRDDMREFMPRLLKLLNQEPMVSDSNVQFCLDKEDFSYYFALDFAVDRIIKTLQTWDVEEGRTKTSIMCLLLWKDFPEFAPVFLARLFKACPYSLPYIPLNGKAAKLAEKERLLSIYLRFQAKMLSTPNTFRVYDINFGWLWFENAHQLMAVANYTDQSFCYVYRDFAEAILPNLMTADANRCLDLMTQLYYHVLPQLQDVDKSAHILKDYVGKWLNFNDFR